MVKLLSVFTLIKHILILGSSFPSPSPSPLFLHLLLLLLLPLLLPLLPPLPLLPLSFIQVRGQCREPLPPFVRGGKDIGGCDGGGACGGASVPDNNRSQDRTTEPTVR